MSDARVLALLVPLLLTACAMRPASPLAPDPALLQVNAAVNRQARPCPRDSCLDHWPAVADLPRLDDWDCKAYAVAKADRLMRQYGYAPARLEYLLIAGAPLRVTHTALLVDGRWVLDLGLRCQVCTLERFVAGVEVTGRLPVCDLPMLMKVLRSDP